MTALVPAALCSVCALALMWSVRGLPRTLEAPPARVAVVIPARNEAHRLPALLASLHGQTHPADRVIVVDDMSSDGTASIARQGGADVVASGGPPGGWTGKTWASELGVRAAAAGPGADLLVLLDADVRLSPDAVVRLRAAHAAAVPDGLLSVQPYHVTQRWFEQLSAFPNLVSVMASGLAAVRRPRRSAVAFGPCLVATPVALAAAGGFAAVRAEAIEDIALARRFGGDGRPVRCLAGRDAVSFRMYGDGLGPLVTGWTKNLAGGARQARLAPTLGAVAWVAGAAAVLASVVSRPSAAGAVAWAAVAVQTWWMLRRLGRFRLWTSAAFAVPLAAFVALFVVSAFRRFVLRSVSWSGRTIAVPGR